jgi:hypothetical protein
MKTLRKSDAARIPEKKPGTSGNGLNNTQRDNDNRGARMKIEPNK